MTRREGWFGARPQGKRAEPGRDCGLAVIATVIATMVAATAISGEAVFIVCVVIAGACMASPIARLVAVEVIERLFAAARHRSSVAVAGIIAVVDMAVEVAGAAEPAAGADEHAAVEPARTVIAVRGTGIGVILVIAPRAIRRAVVAVISWINHRGADADSYPDLGVRWDSSKR